MHLFRGLDVKSSSYLLFGMRQCPFQVNLHSLSGSIWLSLLNGLKYYVMLLYVAEQ